MKNSLGIELPEYIEGYGEIQPYQGVWTKLEQEWMDSSRVAPANKAKLPHSNKMADSLEKAIKSSNPYDGMTVSFHHHLRGGDNIINQTMFILKEMGIKDITLASSSLAEVHDALVPLVEDETITKIWSSGIRGELGKAISSRKLKYPAIIHSHGGRARAIRTGKIKIDLCIVAASAADIEGNATGTHGKSAFGSIGYVMIDVKYAKHVVIVTDNIVDYPCIPMSIRQSYVDQVVEVDSIGDANKIASGTTRITKSPMDLRIAELAAKVIYRSGYIKDDFSFQVGAGGASLAVAKFVREIMKDNGIVGSFMLGGVTSYVVDMLEEGLFKTVFDVQSFDAAVSSSILGNKHHIEIPSTLYANPYNCGCMTNKLDVIVLGALEVDVDFNVNVITGSEGFVRGASGGHSDTASGANLTVVVCPSFRGRIPIVKQKVHNIVTPGESVDIIVTERGICVNPARKDLLKSMKKSCLYIKDIKDLAKEVEEITGKPQEINYKDDIVGIIEYRDGSVIDVIKAVR